MHLGNYFAMGLVPSVKQGSGHKYSGNVKDLPMALPIRIITLRHHLGISNVDADRGAIYNFAEKGGRGHRFL